MKILVVSNMYPSTEDPTYGTFVRNFFEDIYFRNSKGTSDLITIKGRRKSKISKIYAYIAFYFTLVRKLFVNQYDLIYVHTVTFPTPAIRFVAIFKHLPLIFNVHGDDVIPSTKVKVLLRNLSRPLMRKAKLIVSPSEYFKKVILDIFDGISPDKIFVSPSGGIPHLFYNPKTSVNCGNRPFTLGFVSRIDPGKGWHTYIEAISQLKKDGIPCNGIIAGGGSQTTEMLSEIERMGVGDLISYSGPLSQKDLANLYRSFDLFIFPSTRKAESLGLVGLEAMAAGVPVIAANMAGPTSYVIPQKNGYLFQPGSSESLVDNIKKYLNLSICEKRLMSEAAYDYATKFETERISAILFQKIKEMAD